MGYAFISYSSKNQQMADSFRTLFNQNEIKTWMAPGDIPFGSTYTSTINRAIKEASCFVLLLSESAQGSKWVPKETERAVSYGKTIFTILLDDVPMNDDFEFMLSTSQAVAIRKIDENDDNIKRLLQAVATYTGTLKIGDNSTNKEFEENQKKLPEFEKLTLDNRYVINMLTPIGKGRSGGVYSASDKKLNLEVAVKLFEHYTSKTVEIHKTLVNIQSDNLCKIYDVISHPNQCYVTMEWFKDGKNLDEYYEDFYRKIDDNIPFLAEVDVIIDVLKGLKVLHENGIIHSDINPYNILSNGYITKICDFSSSLWKGEKYDKANAPTVLFYSSPEQQTENGIVDERSDIYSVGMVAFQWLCGTVPEFYMNSDAFKIRGSRNDKYVGVLSKAINHNPQKRYQSAQEFIDALVQKKNSMADQLFDDF